MRALSLEGNPALVKVESRGAAMTRDAPVSGSTFRKKTALKSTNVYLTHVSLP